MVGLKLGLTVGRKLGFTVGAAVGFTGLDVGLKVDCTAAVGIREE